jgi:Na+-driven multidrug efflux pump
MIFMGSLRGAGDTNIPRSSRSSASPFCALLAYLFCYPVGWGIYGAWLAFMIDQYLRLYLTLNRFSSGKWASIRL